MELELMIIAYESSGLFQFPHNAHG